MVYFAYVMAWVSTGLVVAVAVNITKSAVPLWALFIPAMIRVGSKDTNKISE